MPRQRVFDLVYDFSHLNGYVRIIENDIARPRGRGPIRMGIQAAATRYLSYLKRRFAAGAGWDDLDEDFWIPQKEDYFALKGPPQWILRMGGQLYESLDYMMVPNGFVVGYVGPKASELHNIAGQLMWTKKRGWVARKKRYPITVGELAYAHAIGARGNPRRRIVVPPNARTHRDIIHFVRQGFRKGAIEANSRRRR